MLDHLETHQVLGIQLGLVRDAASSHDEHRGDATRLGIARRGFLLFVSPLRQLGQGRIRNGPTVASVYRLSSPSVAAALANIS